MATPRNRLSNARKNKRRSHHAQPHKQLLHCPSCQQPKHPHTICLSCGNYKKRDYSKPSKNSPETDN